MLEGVNVEIGGKTDEEDKYIAPTVVTDVKGDEPCMQHEVGVHYSVYHFKFAVTSMHFTGCFIKNFCIKVHSYYTTILLRWRTAPYCTEIAMLPHCGVK